MLLERERLLAVLADRLERARTGEGSLVLVAGEAGAGETSMMRALLAASPAGRTWSTARATRCRRLDR